MAARWLADAAAGDAPFMLFLHSYDCHAPYTKPHVFGRMATPGHDGPMVDRVSDSLTYEKIYNGAFYPDLPLSQLENANGARILTPEVHAQLASIERNQRDVYAPGFRACVLSLRDRQLHELLSHVKATGDLPAPARGSP